MDGKFLTQETSKLVVGIINDNISKKVPLVLRPLTKPVLNLAMNLVNKYADKVVPDSIDAKINEAILLVFSKEYEKAAATAGEALDSVINFEKVNDEVEKLIFVDLLKLIVRQIQIYIENKKVSEPV